MSTTSLKEQTSQFCYRFTHARSAVIKVGKSLLVVASRIVAVIAPVVGHGRKRVCVCARVMLGYATGLESCWIAREGTSASVVESECLEQRFAKHGPKTLGSCD